MKAMPGLAWWRQPRAVLIGRVAWITLRLLLVFWLAQKGDHFYYQAF